MHLNSIVPLINEVKFTDCIINNQLQILEYNSFDVVICAHVLEHVSNLENVFREMRRICKKLLILISPLEK